MTTHIRTINQLSTPLAEQSFVLHFDHVITFTHMAQHLLSIGDIDMTAHILDDHSDLLESMSCDGNALPADSPPCIRGSFAAHPIPSGHGSLITSDRVAVPPNAVDCIRR